MIVTRSSYPSYKPSLQQARGSDYLNHLRYRGVVGHWMLGEGGGVTAYDLSRFGSNGTVSGAIVAPGILGGSALDFDGVNDSVTATANACDNLAAFSISVWARIDGEGGSAVGRIVTKGNWGFMAGDTGGTATTDGLAWFHQTSGTEQKVTTANNAWIPGSWYHLVLTTAGLTATDTHIYLNGVEVAYAAQTNGTGAFADDSANDIVIGARSDATRGFDGRLEDIRIYNRVLNLREVRNLHRYPFAEFIQRRRAYVVIGAATIVTGVGSAAGTSTIAAVGKSTAKAAASTSATATVVAMGKSTAKAVGAAAGMATVTAVGKSTAKAAASAAGTATVTAESKATKKAVGAAAGTSTVAATGQSTHKAVASAAGTSTAEAAIIDANADAVGTASGTSTAAAIARAFALAGGSSQSISTAAAIAQAINKAVASAAGTGLAEAVGTDAAAGVGLNDGDEVMVIQAGGIECSVYHDNGTLVSVVTASATQISVVQAGGTPIRVTI